MRHALAVVVAIFAAVPAAAATPSVGSQVASAAQRAGFSGEVAVAQDGRITYAQGFGQANRTRGTKPSLDTAFNLASIGKTFTGVAVAQLVQGKKLGFDDPIGRYIPSLPSALRAITIGQLLDHTSGLGDVFSDPGYAQRRRGLTSLATYLPLIEHEALRFRPGSRWSYSNSGFILAGLVVEHVSGQPFEAYLRSHVWDPAHMTHTGCFSRAHLPAFAAVGYTSGVPNTATLPPVGTSAGGCYASARDLIAFATALEDGRLLRMDLVREITTAKIAAPGGGYGYGFAIRHGRPGDPPTVWHNGGAPGASGELDINRGRHVVVVTLGNTDPPRSAPVVDAVLNALHVP